MFTVVFDKSTKGRTQVQLWYNRFDSSLGRSSTSTTDECIEIKN